MNSASRQRLPGRARLELGPKGLPHVTASTSGSPHVHAGAGADTQTLPRILALLPCVLAGIYASGWQAELAAATSASTVVGWRDLTLAAFGWSGPASRFALGALWFLPVLATAAATAWAWQSLFGRLRGRRPLGEITITATLFALGLPPMLALWKVALGMSFGLVIGREIFGGPGRNPFHPVLVGLAFLHLAYPAALGALATVPAHAPGLATSAAALNPAEGNSAFLMRTATVPGEASTAACLFGAAVLVWVRAISWRILLGAVIGCVAGTALLGSGLTPDAASVGPALSLALGSLAFWIVFLVTDPVTAAATQTGRLAYGAFVGLVMVLVRLSGATHPEGIVLAALLGNAVAPLMDHGVVVSNQRRRERRFVA